MDKFVGGDVVQALQEGHVFCVCATGNAGLLSCQAVPSPKFRCLKVETIYLCSQPNRCRHNIPGFGTRV